MSMIIFFNVSMTCTKITIKRSEPIAILKGKSSRIYEEVIQVSHDASNIKRNNINIHAENKKKGKDKDEDKNKDKGKSKSESEEYRIFRFSDSCSDDNCKNPILNIESTTSTAIEKITSKYHHYSNRNTFSFQSSTRETRTGDGDDVLFDEGKRQEYKKQLELRRNRLEYLVRTENRKYQLKDLYNIESPERRGLSDSCSLNFEKENLSDHVGSSKNSNSAKDSLIFISLKVAGDQKNKK